MSDKTPYFIRGDDGILRKNPALNPWERRPYGDPGEALNIQSGGKFSLGCTHKRFENYSSFPCGKTPKHDPDSNGHPKKCGHHSAASAKRKKDKADAKMQEWRDRNARNADIRAVKAEMLPLIKSIAEGHNDPRTACREWLDRYEATLPKENAK